MEYYVKIQNDEHFLLRKEIHESLPFFLKENGEVHKQMINASLASYVSKNGLPEIFYNSKKGLLQVFPIEIILKSFTDAVKNSSSKGNVYSFTSLSGKKFNFYTNQELLKEMSQIGDEKNES